MTRSLRMRAGLLVCALALVAWPVAASAAPKRPPLVHNPIGMDAKRKADTADYAQRHYGMHTWRLEHPHVIVEHYTVTTSVAATLQTFRPNVPDSELGELPGLCSHFVIGPRGDIHQLVSIGVMCRHTVGLNYTAIGIEHVGMSAGQVLGNRRQLRASLRLTAWLRCRFGISRGNVIGHAESLRSPYHRELVAALRHQTHADFTTAEMRPYRARLATGDCGGVR